MTKKKSIFCGSLMIIFSICIFVGVIFGIHTDLKYKPLKEEYAKEQMKYMDSQMMSESSSDITDKD